MTREDDPTYLEYAAVRLSADGAAEMDRNRRHIWIPREQIVRLELSFGSAAERPLISLVLGVLLVLLALLGPAIVILGLLRNSIVHTKLVTTLGFIVPALWLLDLSLRGRWFLMVHTKRGTRKLLFTKGSEPAALERFLVTAKAKFGYP